MENSWKTTIFVLNLAFADLLYCSICLPFRAVQYIYQGWFWGDEICTFIGVFDIVISSIEFMSISLIALTKAINLLKPKFGQMWFSGFTGKFILAANWILPSLYYFLLHRLEVSSYRNIKDKE